MSATATILPNHRLHLQHGPIDCILQAWGDESQITQAYRQASEALPAILPALVAELPHLKTPLPTPRLKTPIARAMHQAVTPYARHHITPMAAVAGAIADHLLAAMTAGTILDRAYVNNGGDIAFHLAPGTTLRAGLVTDLAAPALDGIATLHAHHPWRGLATSGRACKGQGGRSFSFGIADAVTVLAATAAEADAAATIIANAVDLPNHPAIIRRPANAIDPDSDLADRRITWDLLALTEAEITTALDAGRRLADALASAGLIGGAVLALRGHFAAAGHQLTPIEPP